MVLETKQAPQSWIGRFNKVIGWDVSRYYCCSEVDWVWIDEKGGVGKVSDDRGS